MKLWSSCLRLCHIECRK